jgi:hypothetical protein
MKNEINIKRIEISAIDNPESIVVEDLGMSFEGSEEEMIAYSLKVIKGLKDIFGGPGPTMAREV